MQLVSVSRSPVAGKKLRATFSDGSHTDFGAACEPSMAPPDTQFD